MRVYLDYTERLKLFYTTIALQMEHWYPQGHKKPMIPVLLK